MAVPPPVIPGDDISNIDISKTVNRDSVRSSPPSEAADSPDWLDRGQKSWDAPFISQQLAEDAANILLGKGALFVPRMAESNLEPDIEILDSLGNLLRSGQAGRKYGLLPGTYLVMVGSGTHRQRIVRPVQIIEGRTATVVPDWCALTIDVVDQDGMPIRGEFEIARIDEFEAYGRGYGRDVNLGEELKTWIFKPGIYKIFSSGESYNTLKNFITVRLLPGEMTRVLLVESSPDFKIIGGGIAGLQAKSALTSKWKYGLDVGGSFLFNAQDNHTTTTAGVKAQTNSVSMALLLNSRLKFKDGPFEWDQGVRLDESPNFEEFKFAHLKSSKDELQVTSLMIWRFVRWFGPYGQFRFGSNLFPQYEYFENSADGHAFFILHPDSTLELQDTLNESIMLKPSFSKLSIQAGVGTNLDIVSLRFVDARIRGGFGLSLKHNWAQSVLADSASLDSTTLLQLDSVRQYLVVRRLADADIFSYGPEAAFNLNIRIGSWADIESELLMLVPIRSVTKPNIDWTTTLSWRLMQWLTLDYQFTYVMHPDELIITDREVSTHRVLVRFSFTTR